MDGNLTLASAVATRLRTDILSGDLPPGCKLRMETLRDRYGIGASPLREALASLAAEGLVLRLDQRGFWVAGADEAALRDLIESRCLVETSALRAAIARGDDAWEERLLVVHHRLARASRSLQTDVFVPNPEWDDLHRAFHLALLDACGAPSLLAFSGELHDRATRFRNIANRTAWRRRDAAVEHAALCEAAIARRSEEAVALLEAHYRRLAHFVGPSLAELEAVQAERAGR